MANPTFGLPRNQLSELSTIARATTEGTNARNTIIDRKQFDRKCHAVALGFFILLAGSAGAALIAMTGGPAVSALGFYGGIAFATTSFILLVVMIVILECERRDINALNEALRRYTEEEIIGNDQIFAAMHTQRFIPRQYVQAVITRIATQPTHFKHFLEYAKERIFAEGRNVGDNPNDLQILELLAKELCFITEVDNEGVQEFLIRVEDQRQILETIPQQTVNDIVERMNDNLFQRHASSVGRNVAAFPKIVRAVAVKPRFVTHVLVDTQRAIFEAVDQAVVNRVVAQLVGEYASKFALHRNFVLHNLNGFPHLRQAIALDERFSGFQPSEQRRILEGLSQEVVEIAIGRLTEGQYNALVTEALSVYAESQPEGYQTVLNALVVSPFVISLTPEHKQKLMERVDAQRMNAIVARHDNAQNYKFLALRVILAYYGPRRSAEENREVVKALAASPHASALLPNFQRVLFEKVDATLLFPFINGLDERQFQAFAQEVLNAYFVSGIAVNKTILRGLSIRSNELTPGQNYTLLTAFNETEVKGMLISLTQRTFNALVEHLATEPAPNAIILKEIVLSEKALASGGLSFMMERVSLEVAKEAVMALTQEAYVNFINEVKDAYFTVDGLGTRPRNPTVLGALLYSQHALNLSFEDKLLLLENAGVETNNAQNLLNGLNVERYREVYASAFREERNQGIYNALASSVHVSSLSVEELYDLIVKVNGESANSLVSRLNEEAFTAFFQEVYNIETYNYLSELLSEQDKIVLNALASSQYTAGLESNQISWLMKRVEQERAQEIVKQMNIEKFNQLVNQMRQPYQSSVLAALFQKAEHLTAEKIFTFLSFMERDDASTVVLLLNPDKYKDVLLHTMNQQVAATTLLKALAQRPSECAKFFNNPAVIPLKMSYVVEEMDVEQKTLFVNSLRERMDETTDEINRVERQNISEIVIICFDQIFTREFIQAFAASRATPGMKALLSALAPWSGIFGKYAGAFNWNQGLWREKNLLNMAWECMVPAGRKIFIENALLLMAQRNVILNLQEMVQIYGIEMPGFITGPYAGQIRDAAQFRQEVIDNQGLIQDEASRHKFALNILEQMDPVKGQDIVTNLDAYVAGSRYTALFTLLVQEAAALPNVGAVAPSRKALYTWFNNSENRNEMAENGLNWTHFNQIVNS